MILSFELDFQMENSNRLPQETTLAQTIVSSLPYISFDRGPATLAGDAPTFTALEAKTKTLTAVKGSMLDAIWVSSLTAALANRRVCSTSSHYRQRHRLESWRVHSTTAPGLLVCAHLCDCRGHADHRQPAV